MKVSSLLTEVLLKKFCESLEEELNESEAPSSELTTLLSEAKIKVFDKYKIDPKALKKFKGEHPSIIRSWLREHAEKNFLLDFSHRPSIRDIRHRFVMKIEMLFNIEISKKHFKLVKINKPQK
jgi:hypothetical protein